MQADHKCITICNRRALCDQMVDEDKDSRTATQKFIT
jgi:hypothetical protein